MNNTYLTKRLRKESQSGKIRKQCLLLPPTNYENFVLNKLRIAKAIIELWKLSNYKELIKFTIKAAFYEAKVPTLLMKSTR